MTDLQHEAAYMRDSMDDKRAAAGREAAVPRWLPDHVSAFRALVEDEMASERGYVRLSVDKIVATFSAWWPKYLADMGPLSRENTPEPGPSEGQWDLGQWLRVEAPPTTKPWWLIHARPAKNTA